MAFKYIKCYKKSVTVDRVLSVMKDKAKEKDIRVMLAKLLRAKVIVKVNASHVNPY